MSDEPEMPKERVYVVQLLPWEAMLILPGSDVEPTKATFDRRKDTFEVEITPEQVSITGGGEWIGPKPGEVQQMHCPSCAGTEQKWRLAGDGKAYLTCVKCEESIIEADVGALLDTIDAAALYAIPSTSWSWDLDLM